MPLLHNQTTSMKLRVPKHSPDRMLRTVTPRASVAPLAANAQGFPATAPDQDDPEVAAFLVALERIFSGVQPEAARTEPSPVDTQLVPLPPRDLAEAPGQRN